MRSIGILNVILDTDISAYAAALLAEELSNVQHLCFSTDVPLSVSIVEYESERRSLLAHENNKYAYTSNVRPVS